MIIALLIIGAMAVSLIFVVALCKQAGKPGDMEKPRDFKSLALRRANSEPKK